MAGAAPIVQRASARAAGLVRRMAAGRSSNASLEIAYSAISKDAFDDLPAAILRAGPAARADARCTIGRRRPITRAMTSSRSALRMPLSPCARSPPRCSVALGLERVSVEGGVGLDGVLAGTPAEVLYDGVIVGSACSCASAWGAAPRSRAHRLVRSWARACSPTRSATWSGSLRLRERRSAAVPVGGGRTVDPLLPRRVRRPYPAARARAPHLSSPAVARRPRRAPRGVRDLGRGSS